MKEVATAVRIAISTNPRNIENIRTTIICTLSAINLNNAIINKRKRLGLKSEISLEQSRIIMMIEKLYRNL